MKAVEAALANRIVGRLGGIYGYGPIIPIYPLAYPLKPDVERAVAAVRDIHNAIIAYEYANAIAGLVAPSVDAVAKVMSAIIDPSGMKKADTAPASATNLQLNAEGVPVLVNPVLMKNEVADADLGMRNWVIEGVNGYDLTQIKAEGVPVLVNPESELLKNEVGSLRLNPCVDVNGNSKPCEVGPDEVNIVQLEPEDAITLQVNGVPVLVNPESELLRNEVGSLRLNPCVDVNGNSKPCEIGPDEVNIIQTAD